MTESGPEAALAQVQELPSANALKQAYDIHTQSGMGQGELATKAGVLAIRENITELTLAPECVSTTYTFILGDECVTPISYSILRDGAGRVLSVGRTGGYVLNEAGYAQFDRGAGRIVTADSNIGTLERVIKDPNLALRTAKDMEHSQGQQLWGTDIK